MKVASTVRRGGKGTPAMESPALPYFPLAVCAEMLWQDKPIEWRVSKLTEMGFAVGLWNWPAHDLDKLEKTKC